MILASSVKSKKFRRFQRMPFKNRPPTDQLIHDQRYLPRWETANKAYYRNDAAHQIVLTQLRNLNLEGASLYVKENVAAGQFLTMKIYLNDERSFFVKGKVVWRVSTEASTYVGVTFGRLEEHIQQLIMEYAL